MKIISKVNNLTRHDLIYVYDKLKIGEQVEISEDENGKCIWVMYQNKRIGTLENFDLGFWGLGGKLKARINSISKNKYLPFENLDIEIKPTF